MPLATRNTEIVFRPPASPTETRRLLLAVNRSSQYLNPKKPVYAPQKNEAPLSSDWSMRVGTILFRKEKQKYPKFQRPDTERVTNPVKTYQRGIKILNVSEPTIFRHSEESKNSADQIQSSSNSAVFLRSRLQVENQRLHSRLYPTGINPYTQQQYLYSINKRQHRQKALQLQKSRDSADSLRITSDNKAISTPLLSRRSCRTARSIFMAQSTQSTNPSARRQTPASKQISQRLNDISSFEQFLQPWEVHLRDF